MQFKWSAAVIPLVFAGPFAAQAQDSDVVELDPVTITATRTADVLSDSLAATTVITREEIEKLQPQDLQDLLTGLPGVSIANNGGPGKATSLFVRGTESDHVLVLVDGVKMGSATSGGAALQDIPVEQIERIELVRGPRSSLYGSEAIGGVLQIFTRHGGSADGSVVPSFSVGGGSMGTVRGDVGLRGNVGEGGWYAVNASGRYSDGIDAEPGAGEPDKDGYRNLAGTLRGGWNFANGAQLSLTWLRVAAHNEFDGSYDNNTDGTQQALGADLRFSPLAGWDVHLNAGESRDESDNYENSTWVSAFDTRRRYGAWQNDVSLSANQMISLGVDYQDDVVNSDTVYEVTSRNDKGVYLQYQGDFGRQELQASVRHDDNEQFDTYDTGALAWGYRISDALRLSASYGTAFKAPTFNELYYPGYGNADLKPEKSQSSEIGLAGTWTRLDWAVNAYHTLTKDLISYDSTTYAPANIDEAEINGVELQLGTRIQALSLHGNFTWMDPQDNASGSYDGNVLARRARQSGRIDADYAIANGRGSVGATVYAAGARYDNLSNTTRLGGYTTLNLRAQWAMTPRWMLQVSGDNLLDRDYETAAGYAEPGATGYVTVRYTPAL